MSEITHEQARENAEILNSFDNEYGGLKESYKELLKYIDQQEQKEKEFEEYKISDASKEQSSINYYNELKELKRDVKRYFELDAMNWDLAHNEDIRENRKQYKERILSKVGNE